MDRIIFKPPSKKKASFSGILAYKYVVHFAYLLTMLCFEPGSHSVVQISLELTV